ncbi:MAG TPA: M14 family zinc carboxypeptidase [Solirubrobacterales bacterium]
MKVNVAAALALAALAAGAAGGGAAADPPASTATQQEVLGRSVQKRAITAVQVGDPAGTRVALVVGVIHGDERAGLRIVRAVKREASRDPGALTGTQLWAIATVNPDGLRAHTRKNAHGVDLNRNFPYRWHGDVPHSSGYYPGPRPASEPETRAVMAFVRRLRPDLSIWYHQPWGAVLACHGNPRIAVIYARLVGMRTSCRGAGLRGTAISWETHTVPGSSAFVVEMPSGRISGRSALQQARGALTVGEGR